jgi:hypothetical protein
MQKIKLRYIYILLTIIIIALFSITIFNRINHPYGNDRESIIKVIRSIDGYQNGTVEILDIKDIKNTRIAALLYNHHPAYMEFIKNSSGNYEWRHIEKDEESLAPFSINIRTGSSKIVKFLIITNQENQIAKLELGVNDQIISQTFDVGKNSAVWLNLPESRDHSYRFSYKYFDKEGNPIADR